MQSRIIIKLLGLSHTSTTVELRASTALLIAEMLPCIGGEQTCRLVSKAAVEDKGFGSTYRRVPHSRNFASSWTGCPVRGKPPLRQLVQGMVHSRYSTAEWRYVSQVVSSGGLLILPWVCNGGLPT
jgi:hypothetical protein